MQHGREHPWNIRRVTHRHLHDQRNLADLRLLTQAWTAEIKPPESDSPEPTLEAEPEPAPIHLGPSLEDDTWPQDVLLRLESEIRAEQLDAIGSQVKESRDTHALAQRSYQAGQESAGRRWMQSDASQGSIAPADKRALLLTLFHGPLGGRLGPAAFLIRRSLITEVSVELLQCPHRHAAAPGDAAADELCRQQFHWLRGYFNFLNPAISPALARPFGRCVVSW